ncbi:MAG: GNAT family N-acetyltransferase [Thermoplasmata archaeon]|nr:GNAT family N-acetyltransferase [Thermoplasmata archaeon]
MAKIQVRDVDINDLPALEKLTAELISTLENKDNIDIKRVSENLETLFNDSNSYIIVAEINNVIVGFLNLSIRQTIMHSGPSCLIDELVVTESYRDHGVGRELILAAIEKSQFIDCCEIEVSTEFANTSAIEFYNKLGFQERGILLEKV